MGDASDEGAVSVGIVLYNNSHEEIIRCLTSLWRQSASLVKEVLVLDQGSQGVPPILSNAFPVHVFHGPNNGFGAGHNKLLQHATAPFYLCLNPDAVLHPDCLAHLMEMSDRSQHQALVEAIQEPIPHPKTYDAETGETPWCSAACLLMPRAIVTALKGFDERFFLYCEDVDLSWRARAAGFSCRIAPAAKVFHFAGDRGHRRDVHQDAMKRLRDKWEQHPARHAVQPDFTHAGTYARPLW